MCSLCAALGAGRDWTDAAGHDAFRHNGGKVNQRNEREARVAVLEPLLAVHGITIKDWGGNSYLLEDRDGRRRNVYNLAGIWSVADELTQTPCDPLDTSFLENVARASDSMNTPAARALNPAVPHHAATPSPQSGASTEPRHAATPSPQLTPSPEPRRAGTSSPQPSTPAERWPVFVLTGFLGSGKTTLLRRVLTNPEFADSAIIINELGEVALDHELVAFSTDSMIVLQGGCVCCTIRQDIEAALRELIDARDAGTIPPFRRLIIETTGIADPQPLVFTLHVNPLARERLAPPRVITIVDGVLGEATVANHPEPSAQIAAADSVVVSKRDLTGDTAMTSSRGPPHDTAMASKHDSSEDTTVCSKRAPSPLDPTSKCDPLPDHQTAPCDPPPDDALLSLIRRINPWTTITRADLRTDDLAWLFVSPERTEETLAWDVAERPALNSTATAVESSAPDSSVNIVSDRSPVRDRNSHGDVRTVCLTLDQPLNWTGFGIWMTLLLHRHGRHVLRMKGILEVDGRDGPVIFHCAQHLVHPPEHLDQWPSTDHRSKLIFVVRGLDPALIERSLRVIDAVAKQPPRGASAGYRGAGAGGSVQGRPIRRATAPRWMKG